MLPVRACGTQGFECAAQGLGCASMSAFYKGFETEEAQAEAQLVLKNASDFPSMMLDTADICGPHTNERLIGKVVPSNRVAYKIATKCGILPVKDPTKGLQLDSSPQYVKQACQDSLDRLGVECIDLYYLQRYDMKTPIEETMQAFKELIQEGKIKYVGVSELGIENLRKAHAVCPITAYQMEWNVFTRDVEEKLVPTCRELGIGIVVYSPLGRGFFTGTIEDANFFKEGDTRKHMPRLSDHIDENLKLLEVIRDVADAKGCTMGQVALAWIHAQGEDVFPIPGTKRRDRFLENVAAINIQLSEEEMEKLNAIADHVKGERHTAAMMKVAYNGAQAELA